MQKIDTVEQLRTHYPAVSRRANLKQLDHIDQHAQHFISLSPFMLLASTGANGRTDVTPRGGPAGFVQVLDTKTLLIPDWPGNNRLDSLSNIIETAEAGLLFMIPGVDETLRINGAAVVTADAEWRGRFVERGKQPATVMVLTVRELFLHCAKALMRSALWHPEARQDRAVLPTMGEMLRDQIGDSVPAESQQEMIQRYQAALY